MNQERELYQPSKGVTCLSAVDERPSGTDFRGLTTDMNHEPQKTEARGIVWSWEG